MKFKKVISTVIAALMVVSMAGCSGGAAPKATDTPAATDAAKSDDTANAADSGASDKQFLAAMVTDTGGVNDLSFNQSSWEGLQLAEKDLGIKPKYLESKQEADYASNLDKLADEKPGITWGIGFLMGDAVKTAAQKNPDLTYAIVDYAYKPEDGKNLIGVVFKAQEPSFEVGYIAAKTTKTNKVGFVGGVKSDIIDQFEFGYRAGVAYAAKELGKDISVEVQYTESWTDDAKGKAIATQMYTTKDCDIVFHAAGGAGKGVIEAAKDLNKYAIGVDRDQSDMAPNNVLTSAMKLVGKAMYMVTKDVKEGKAAEIGGTTIVYGLKEGGVGIPDSKLVDPAVATATKAIEQDIIAEKIVVPFNQDTFDKYIAALK